MSLLLCLCTLGLFFFLPKDSNTKNVSFFKNFANLKNILKKQSLLLCYLVAFLLLLSFVLMYSFLMSKLAIEPYNLSTSEQLKIRLFGLLGMIISPLAGKLSAKVGIKNLLVYSLSLTVFSSILFIFSKSIVTLTILSVIFVLGIALAVPSLVTLVNFFGEFERGLSVSTYTFILFLGTSFAPVIVSFSTTFSKTNINFSILSMITLISFITSLIIKRK
jgi:MFS family permease